MVRRKSMARGLANQLRSWGATYQQQLMAQPQYSGWLPSTAATTPPYANNYHLLHWQHPTPTLQARSMLPAMSTLCNKMAGCMPRLASLPQPELSSPKLSRLRQSLLRAHPETVAQRACNAYVLPAAQSEQRSNWCRSSEQVSDRLRARQQADYFQQLRLFKRQQRLQQQQQLQQQLQQRQVQQLQQHQQQLLQHRLQQQQQRWQQPAAVAPTSAAPPKSDFQYFNFGNCAELCIPFRNSESVSSLYSATHPSALGVCKPQIIPKQSPLEQCESFSYVKAAKQMAKTSMTNKASVELKSSPKALSTKITPAGKATSSTTLISMPPTPVNSLSETISGKKSISTSSMTLPHSEGHLSQLATDIDLNLTAIRQLLETKLPQKEKELDKLASLLQQRVGINSQPGVHLQGGESKTSPKRSQKKSRARQLNLNRLFKQSKSPNPMWDTLMQLAAHMCENKDVSSEQPPKQYSIYLMVNSDDEDNTEDDVEGAQQTTPHYNSSNSRILPSLNYKMHQNISMPWTPQPSIRKKKKKKHVLLRLRREQELQLSATRPPRRPLHWPKQDFSKPVSKLKKSKKLKLSAQSSRKIPYHWT
ncbi:uncharacterized protein LOC117571314 [Drosophila albomicans]|uniref:Uncharacterized protein LOC117571314 n=1 Tax=Drosophila albomicans TaxID=7291 RepID=A0A6P8X933_DROAB|nr:uncharacterized protein LOC117571314 [Drosophila albomicans]